MTFWDYRLKALKEFLNATSLINKYQNPNLWNNQKIDSFCCVRQYKVQSEEFLGEKWHLSTFCCMSDWLDMIKFLLEDSRLDDIKQDEFIINQESIFYFHANIYLLVYELERDLNQLYGMWWWSWNIFNWAKYLAWNWSSFDGFLNNFIKHKENWLYICDHHLEKWIEDLGSHAVEDTECITMKNYWTILWQMNNSDWIKEVRDKYFGLLLPNLNTVVNDIMIWIRYLNNFIEEDPQNLQSIIEYDNNKYSNQLDS